MKMTEAYFRTILAELIEENPIACQGILSIAEIVFTEEVKTLSVSLSNEPSLQVNMQFLSANARTETEVKSLIMHEFLHVLLNHTEQYKVMDRATNIALDSVINAIIHRSLGPEYSTFMSRYYADMKGYAAILRPMNEKENDPVNRSRPFHSLWRGIYDGKLVVDDILSIAAELASSFLLLIPGSGGAQGGLPGGGQKGTCRKPGSSGDEESSSENSEDSDPEIVQGRFLLGGHKRRSSEAISEHVKKVLEETMQSMNGHGIWRSPGKICGHGRNPYDTMFTGVNEKMRKWEVTAWRALMECVTPDRSAQIQDLKEIQSSLPVFSTNDRRAFLRGIWCPFIPDSLWKSEQRKPVGNTQVYLDVSGSMHAEMQSIVGLLSRMRRHIRMPFWAFSDQVAPAVIKNGVLKTSTSGGTSMNSVLEHVATTKPGKAVIVTDGYIEECDNTLLMRIRDQKITVILSRDGSGETLERARIKYVQLERYPS